MNPHAQRLDRPYHSARKPELEAAPMDRWEFGSSAGLAVALAHDVFAPLPEEFRQCDVFYTEPAWRPGYELFLRRAGVEPRGKYGEYIARIGTYIQELKIPSFLVLGKHAERYAPPPVRQFTYRIDAFDDTTASCFVYHTDFAGSPATQTALLDRLAQQYRMIGDCCCGYGWTGHAFVQAGGSGFVLSDVNPKCVGYIAAHAPAWFDHE